MARENRLRESKSPYLLQHAENPVHWQPWDEEALTQALLEDKPIFLSVGYSTCHWCHVMAHESFENADTARLLNEHFLPIKVDREERPDIDQIYMTAIEALTGSGGWPLSAFLLPEGLPFAGGTYYTPGRFRKILENIADVYRTQRRDVEGGAEEVGAVVAQTYRPTPVSARVTPSAALVEESLEVLEQSFDAAHGGFGRAPKFPPYNALFLLIYNLQYHVNPTREMMVRQTLEAMALGGLHDHIGGGFHRYATDIHWCIPHYEKMLYDNALLAQAYTAAAVLLHDPYYRLVAEATYTWIEREMTHHDGGFCCGWDADSDGVEGKYYLWTKAEILDALGDDEGELFSRLYHVEAPGNFRAEQTGLTTGQNILYLTKRVRDDAPELGIDEEVLVARMLGAQERLRQVRERREPPHRDDKILASWNGLTIGSLAYAGRVLEVPKYLAMAEKAAEFLQSHLWINNRLFRRWRDDEAAIEGFLDDYANLAHGLLELFETTQETRWLEWAQALGERMLEEFRDTKEGDFFYTGVNSESLFVRPKEFFDHPLPASNAVAAQVLHRLALHTGRARYEEAAAQVLRALTPLVKQQPHSTESAALAMAMFVEGTEEAKEAA